MMKPEDFPLVEFKGRRLRRVPELPCVGDPAKTRCDMCDLKINRNNRHMCSEYGDAAARSGVPDCDEGSPMAIFLPEEHFQEYVVELVRRRIS
jgi:hypothetical protein